MIISASRRTDLPAFFADWLMNRVRAGFCMVQNPFDARQVSRVSLQPRDVDAVVFWTRNPRPLLRHLGELDARGFRYMFQYTLMDNPKALDPRMPSLSSRTATFRQLAERLGPERVIWRYDPIVLTHETDVGFHLSAFERIMQELSGHVSRVIVSVVDAYRPADARLHALFAKGALRPGTNMRANAVQILRALNGLARANGLDVQTCAEPTLAAAAGLPEGKCIDGDYIARVLGVHASGRKDRGQRAGCLCIESRDIGAYNTCAYDCTYCYAVSDQERARERMRQQDPGALALGSAVKEGPVPLTLFDADSEVQSAKN